MSRADDRGAGAAGGLPDHVLQQLVASHREFVGFVARRVGDRALAEDIVQDAFIKGVERGGGLRGDESAWAWFHRVLRNAIVDRHRRATTATARLQACADDLQRAESQRLADGNRELCACIARLIDTLPPDQAKALRRIELDGVAVKVTRACGTCAEHGCFDCSCRAPDPSGGAANC